MKRKRGLFRLEGYSAFQMACEIHEALMGSVPHIDGGSRKMAAIYRVLDKAYNDGVEDALQHGDEWIAKQRKWLGGRERDI